MKDFILYLQPKGQKKSIKTKKYDLKDLKNTAGTSSISELEIVESGELKFKEELGDYQVFNFSCKYIARLGTSLVTADLNIELWQSKKGVLVVSYGFPRKVANVAIKLLALATLGDYTLINSIIITESNFFELKKKVLALGGTVTQLEGRGVSWGGGRLRQIEIKGLGLEKIPGFDGVFDSAKTINSMGFSLPELDNSTRRISFKIINWGGGQIFSPSDPLPHEQATIFNLIEEIIFGISRE